MSNNKSERSSSSNIVHGIKDLRQVIVEHGHAIIEIVICYCLPAETRTLVSNHSRHRRSCPWAMCVKLMQNQQSNPHPYKEDDFHMDDEEETYKQFQLREGNREFQEYWLKANIPTFNRNMYIEGP